jgi:recombination protein RecA
MARGLRCLPNQSNKTSVLITCVINSLKKEQPMSDSKREDSRQERPENPEQKQKTISATIASIERQFGQGTIMRLQQNETPSEDVAVIPSGALSLDIATGIGGIPRGRIIEIYGPESSGKTTLALHMLAETQKMGGVAAFIDAEHALDLSYARNIGIKFDNFLISQPDTGEQALEIVEMLVRSQAVDAIIVDSVAALVPRAEVEGDMGDAHMGLQARLMSQALRKLTSHVYKSNGTVIFINQIRQKIGVVFGNPETTTGGNALKFYASMRLEIRRTGHLKDGDQIIGNQVRVKVVKNKMAPPYQEAEFDILFGAGISTAGEVVGLATDLGILQKNGTWYSYHDERLGQGKENVRSYLLEHPEIMSSMRQQILDSRMPARNLIQKAA